MASVCDSVQDGGEEEGEVRWEREGGTSLGETGALVGYEALDAPRGVLGVDEGVWPSHKLTTVPSSLHNDIPHVPLLPKRAKTTFLDVAAAGFYDNLCLKERPVHR